MAQIFFLFAVLIVWLEKVGKRLEKVGNESWLLGTCQKIDFSGDNENP